MNTSLKHLLIPCIIAGMLAACGKKEQPGNPQDSTAAPQDTAMASTRPDSTVPPAPYVFFNIDSLKTALVAGKHRIDEALTDTAKSRGYINTLSGSDPASIPYAIHYIKHHPAPAGSALYDTLYKQFVSLYYLVSVSFSKVAAGPTWTPVLDKRNEQPDDPAVKNLLDYLKLYSLNTYYDEYGPQYYIDADPNLYYNIFHMKASPALQKYLNLQGKDKKEGFYTDGGIAISLPKLYQRIESWGLFIAEHPHFLLTKEALNDYRMYLSVLLKGIDNAPVFSSEPQSILPEIKTLYETIMASGKDHVSKKIVTDYYNFLAKNDFKSTDSIYTFLNHYDLAAMFKK